ncbi:MAG TPA: class II aldolase/adducin family protein [Solirubrobacteraceae bacterium]|nr:class II aldolase/adducin family protein [Solirubrobacteraceae bacterium]
MPGGDFQRERERVAVSARRLAADGLVTGTAGNVSARAGERVVVTPTGARLEDVTAEQIALVDLDGEQVGGDLAPTSELELHLRIYRRLDAGAVVHSHARFATAVACVLDELPVVHYQMLALGGPIRVAPYATFGTPELAELTLKALDGRSAALMANHGAIAYGPDLDTAMEHALLLEWACELYWRASALGTPRTLGRSDQLAFVETVSRRGYGITRRSES